MSEDVAFSTKIFTFIYENYGEELERIVRENKNYFTVNFQSLNSDLKEQLNTNYIEYTYGSTTLDDIIYDLYRRKTIELGTVPIPIQTVKLLFRNVTPVKKIREITSDDINGLMQVNGIVISVIPPHSIMAKAIYRCSSCKEEIVVQQFGTELIKPSKCVCGKKRGFILLESKCEWDDYQEIVIQENPEEVDAGVIPRTIKGRVKGQQLVDKCKPGDMVNLNCALIPIPIRRSGKERIFGWILDINNVELLSKDSYSIELTEDDKHDLMVLSTNPNIDKSIIKSIFPSIYGRENEKEALTLAAFKGVARKRPDIYRRGDINVLLIGDPSTGKTRMLQAIKNAVPKGMYAQAGGASGVGLTAAAVQDQYGWRLEAGTLVLSDGGLCCIDEIEKISNEDLKKIHEAMSSGSISIHKADIHTTLNARTGIIAAANPTEGRYDELSYLTDNISLTPTLLSRFDLIFIIKDKTTEEEDRNLAMKIFDMEEEDEIPMIDHETLKKYILYARTIKPRLTADAIDKIMEYFISLRNQSRTQEHNPIAITTRQLEGMVRLAEARARMFLRDEVGGEDAEVVIELMKESLKEAGYDPKTGKIDIDVFMTGKPKSKTDNKKIIEQLLMEHDKIHSEELLKMVERYGINERELEEFLNDLVTAGRVYTPTSDIYRHRSHLTYRRRLDE